MKIIRVQVFIAEIPLKNPYVLSFTTVEKIDTIVVRLFADNGGEGVGEAVPLPGYSHETKKSIISDLHSVLADVVGLECDDLEDLLLERIPKSPFAMSALMTANEFASAVITIPPIIQVPILGAVSAALGEKEVLQKVLEFYSEGFRTIKLKVGRDINEDRRVSLLLLNELPEDVRIRIDANQAYSLDQAYQLVKTLDHPRNNLVELLEQPFGIDEWGVFKEFASNVSHVPLMLDESIVNDSDIEKAADVGADLVKLKLFKQRGINGLKQLAQKAINSGMKVVLGNGVASDLGNIAEAVACHQNNFFTGALESNGFAKLVFNILHNPPIVETGNLIWEPVAKNNHLSLAEERLTLLEEVAI